MINIIFYTRKTLIYLKILSTNGDILLFDNNKRSIFLRRTQHCTLKTMFYKSEILSQSYEFQNIILNE